MDGDACTAGKFNAAVRVSVLRLDLREAVSDAGSELPETTLATRTSWLLSNVWPPKNFRMLPPLPPGEGRGRRRVARTLLGEVAVDDADDDKEGGGGGSAASS